MTRCPYCGREARTQHALHKHLTGSKAEDGHEIPSLIAGDIAEIAASLPVSNGAAASELSPVQHLARAFYFQGHLRRQNPERLVVRGWWGYKKGDEVRFQVSSQAELRRLRQWLRQTGFKPGRSWCRSSIRKRGYPYRQPLYGREQVARFLVLIRPARPW